MVSADASYGGAHQTLQHRLEEIIKQMFMIWCKETVAVKLLTSQPSECDKTVVVQRESGEFGFRIHGSRPVVVSAIEPETPAESSGLEVGDIIIRVNSVNVLDASHSEVVKLAHAGSDTLELEVARTCNVLTPVVREPSATSPLFSGFLWKQRKQPGADSKANSKWIERWFCLKRDNCLYYYKNDSESQALGALMLANYNVSHTPDGGRPYGFQLWRDGAAGLCLAADSEESATRWVAVIGHSIERNSQGWCASTDTEFKTPIQEGRDSRLNLYLQTAIRDISTSTPTQKWTERDGLQPSSTPSTGGSKWGDGRGPDVPAQTAVKTKPHSRAHCLSFDGMTGSAHSGSQQIHCIASSRRDRKLLASW